MRIICQYDMCTGCQVCRVACPKHCISMQEDSKGNIYPVVDNTLCVNCKRCQKVCPSLNPPVFSKQPIEVYAGWVKDKNARKNSTSGGISYILSKHFLERGDTFCGAIWTKDGAIHKLSSDISDIKKYQGSKYSHSDVKNCYKEIQDVLISGCKVLFSGTPCQVAALRNYLNKEYDNLFTIDIICHGVPSRKILRDRISDIEKEYGKNVVEMRFRDKQPDQLRTCCKYIFEDGTFVLHEYAKDFFFRSFVDNYALRENCFHCNYSRIQRVSDMTIADFWGYQPRSLKFLNHELGVSIIFVNNTKGEELINMVKNSIVYEKRDYHECINRNMYSPQLKPNDYDSYWADYENGDISKREIQSKYLSSPATFHLTWKYELRKFSNAFFSKTFMDNVRKVLKTIRKFKQ